METFVQLTTQDEETGSGQAVRNHLDHRAWYASWLPV